MAPRIRCPFPVRINPYTRDTEEYLRGALASVGAPDLSGFGIGRLAGLAYPDVAATRLRIAALWFSFFWLFDDAWADRLPLHRAGELDKVHRRVAEILGGDSPTPADHPSLRTLGLLQEEIRSVRPGWDATAFHREVLRYLQATWWEVDLRLRVAIPTVLDYVRMRPHIAAVPASRELDFLICDLRLDPRLYTHPLVELADSAAGNFSCWVNDICSLDTERGAATNLVVVARHHFSWSRDQAIEWVLRTAADELATFQTLRRTLCGAQLPGTPLARGAREDLHHYLDHYEGWFVASAEWMTTTSKYRTDEVPA